VFEAQHPKYKGAVRRTEAGLSIGEDGLVRGYPVAVQDRVHLLRRLESVSVPVHQVGPFQVSRPGNVTLPLAAAVDRAIVFS
jgi:hypothetical protein